MNKKRNADFVFAPHILNYVKTSFNVTSVIETMNQKKEAKIIHEIDERWNARAHIFNESNDRWCNFKVGSLNDINEALRSTERNDDDDDDDDVRRRGQR